jgi:hypothetical protein
MSRVLDQIRFSMRNATEDEVVQEPIFTGDSLSKDDLKNQRQYAEPIREYMVARKGVDYLDKPDEEVVDDFIEQMRYFNANTVSTATEARFIHKADDVTKNKARRAYEIYDNLGNVFQNDGVFGAVDGVKDYVFASASDPSNYLGLLTGGVGRFVAGSYSFTGKKIIRDTVAKAAREAALGGAGREAAAKAGIEAGKIAAKKAVAAGASSKAADKAAAEVVKRVTKENRRGLARKAALQEQNRLFGDAAKKSLYYTAGADATIAVLNDVTAQRTMLAAGSQESYSYTQSVASSLLGGVASGAQLLFGRAKGASGLAEDVDNKLSVATKRIIEEELPLVRDAETKEEVVNYIVDTSKSWADKVEDGKGSFSEAMPGDLLKTIVFGDNPDEIGGLAKIMHDAGVKVTKNTTVSDLMTNIARSLEAEDLVKINEQLAAGGIYFGDLTANKGKLSDMLANKISDAAKTLNVQSQLSKTLDSAVVAGQDAIQAAVESVDAKKAIADEKRRAEGLRYGQSVWKRLLVSSPATTAVNVAGFGQYYIGQSVADLFNAGLLGVKGLGEIYTNPMQAQNTFQQMRALTTIQSQKFRNLLDPYTTHDEYMRFLGNNKDVSKILFETYAGGVESNAARYNIDPDALPTKLLESYANASAQISGVRIQDSFTKSQMFMTEMDKYLRAEKGMTLREALSDETFEMGEDVIQAALDATLKSVYAKDYTTNDQLLGKVAGVVETASNAPGIGLVLPFGRFMNNVVATSYQWSILSAPGAFKNIFRKMRAADETVTITETDALARSMVGTAALAYAMSYDEERKKEGLGPYEVKTVGGTIIDAKNTFPLSVFLAVGRVGNLLRNGETVPREIQLEALNQLAIGQVARDLQFGNDLINVADTLFNIGDGGQRAATADAFYKATGNVVAGATRPLDVVNKTVGFLADNDTAKDVRQADGLNVFTQSATKYIDNVLEAFADSVGQSTPNITGEKLRVAAREGDIYDPAPFARLFGLTVKPGATATERVYSMADMMPWTASERTKIPAYDKILNGLVAPALERETMRLLRNPKFKEANLDKRRLMLDKVVKDVKKEMRKQIRKGSKGGDAQRLLLAEKIGRKKKELKREAMKMAKEQFGIDGALEDMDYRELGIIEDYISYLDDIYEEASKL